MTSLLADMAWTASVGRTHFDFRAGLVFEDAESLRQELESLANGGDRGEQRDSGALPATGVEVENASDSGNGRSFVQAAAQAYEAGRAVSFESLFAGEERRRISLPGYPFQRRSYWINT